MWYIGQKVVCVDDNWRHKDHPKHWHTIYPILKQIYTIREISKSEDAKGPIEGHSFRFYEIKNKKDWFVNGYGEPNFFDWHFEPLVEKKTDISTFKKLLVPTTIETKVKRRVKENV
jgi:hypothetical protein